jgi:ATP-dependent DNA ligase
MKESAAASFVEPMMARLVRDLPAGDWIYELKFDDESGRRIGAWVKVKLTRGQEFVIGVHPAGRKPEIFRLIARRLQ